MKKLGLFFIISIMSVPHAALAQELMNNLESKMGRLSQRQALISKNIANANTPGYVAQDVEMPKGKKQARHRLGMMRTNPSHLAGAHNAGSAMRIVKDEYAEKTPDGNQVDLVHETEKSSQTSMDYDVTTMLYKHMSEMMKKAVGGQ